MTFAFNTMGGERLIYDYLDRKMVSEPTWISVIPPVLAIILAIWTRQVYISLLAGICLGWILLKGGDLGTGLAASVEGLVTVFANGENTKVILFCGLVGGLITLVQCSGGVAGFVEWGSGKGWLKSRRSIQLASSGIGCMVFVETSISALIVGTICRPLYDRMNISREKLAYVCDSTSAPVNLLIPLNAWGAYIVGLLTQNGIKEPIGVLVSAIPFNFYAWGALATVFVLILWGRDFGPMKRAELLARQSKVNIGKRSSANDSVETLTLAGSGTAPPRMANMVVPIGILILMMPVGLFITGGGDITKGSGTTAVFWAVLSAIVVAGLFYRIQGIMKIKEISAMVIRGIQGMVPMMVLMMLAFAIGDITRELGTGLYVAKLATRMLDATFIPVLLFVCSCFIAFSTGTSWGTYAILVPIAVSVASQSGLSLPLLLATVLGGGLFGDHSSPISDTTLISSMASSCDHISHVRTQLPYALLAAGLSIFLYIIIGLL